MIIRKKRVLSFKANLGDIKPGEKINVYIEVNDDMLDKLLKVGFSGKLSLGEKVLPSGIFGNISLFNAEGKYIKHKNKPKETAYRQALWKWKEWHGPYDRVERERIVDVPYKRYPRTFIKPPSIELSVSSEKGQKIVSAPVIKYKKANEELILHIINLFLEIFGECQVSSETLDVIKRPVERLNWKVLPSGEYPWEKLINQTKRYINRLSKQKRYIAKDRLEFIRSLNPDFYAYGQAGFAGYIIMGFKKYEIYVLESLFYGNATYIFGTRWEELSKKTKAEILGDELQEHRLVHNSGWKSKIDKVLENEFNKQKVENLSQRRNSKNKRWIS